MRSAPRSLATNPFAVIARLLTDLRFLRVVGQIVFVVVVVFAISQVWNSISGALESRNLTPNFAFLENRAGFEIGGAEGYSPDDSYWQAFQVGLRNTLSIIVVGLVGATVLGVLGGIFLLSNNWLIRNITRLIVEVLRNTPLLVQLFIVFFVVVLALPPLRDSITLPNEGIFVLYWAHLLYLIAAVIIAVSTRRANPERRALLWGGWAAVIVSMTALNRFAPGATFTDNTVVLIVLAISVICLVAGGVYRQYRPLLWGIAAGNLIGSGLFLLNVLPGDGLRFEMRPLIYLNARGFTYPELLVTSRFAEWFAFVAIGIGLGVFLWIYLRRVTEQTGKPYPALRYAFLVALVFAIVGWIVVSSEPSPNTIPVQGNDGVQYLSLEEARAQELLTREDELLYDNEPLQLVLPRRQGLRFAEGETISPEYMALLLALIIYTSAYTAEIVRAGILAVPSGQIEASRALGLTYSQMLRKVVLPQALRVIIPPLTNQYTNLAKNSSLAIAISFADVYQVMNTVGNQSGQSVTSIVIVMIAYAVISLVIAGVMNLINGRFQLVVR